jgi:hypothetical protein
VPRKISVMAKRTKMPTGVEQQPMPAYGQPMLRLQRDAPGARWARLGLRAIVLASVVAAVAYLIIQAIH